MTDKDVSLKEHPMMGHTSAGADFDPDKTHNLELIQRRAKHFAGSFLFYHDPVHLVRGEGVWLYDADGNKYLDCYNNVASVGHCHPRVVKALSDQAALLNTHTRYLSENVVELAEAYSKTLPGDLEVCLFVCTGTEACELAMRIARVVTGNSGAIVMENSYHGNSKLVGEMSTAVYPPDRRPAWIQAIEPPNIYRGSFREDEVELGKKYAACVDPAITALQNSGEGVAAFVADSIFDSQGALAAPPDYLREVYARVRAAGGLCIADEVQAGFCRTGKFWGFEHYDVVPDIVFTGKPAGAGHPVAVVFTTREIADKWAASDIYFNTFGGNPVSAAAASAVLDVIAEENIQQLVQDTGAYLRQGLEKLAAKHPIIGNVQGRGMFLGIDLVSDRDSREPAADIARQLPDAMKDEGVLIGLTGRHGNVLKFRPPMVFNQENADEVLAALDRVLTRFQTEAEAG